MLSDSRRGDRSISSIAAGALSYLIRAFRRRYGATPTAIRRGAETQRFVSPLIQILSVASVCRQRAVEPPFLGTPQTR
jgi:AraC-like DNA-binding protein